MAQIKFLGAAGYVTGSCYLLTGNGGDQILIDLGIFQGDEETEKLNILPLAFNPAELKAVLLTHAHLDHCGRLPLLVKNGYRGKIYATDPTRDLTHISLSDAAQIALENPEVPALYSKDDVEKVIQCFTTVSYDQPFTIGEFNITFRNAGHILGSASIEVTDSDNTIVFSGDLGNTPEDLIQPTENIFSAGTVLIESTYGSSVHPVEDVSAILRQEINAVENSSGTLIIPAFSIERTQEILHQIGHLKQNGGIKTQTPVFLDSPMAIEVTEIFKKYPNLYSSELSQDPHPFDFPNLICTKKSEDSKKIINTPGPKVILAGSGMMSGGRVMHHLKNYISLPTTRILIVGYQATGTMGREIESGATEIIIYKEHLSVKATITKLESLSSHADQPKLVNWLKNIKDVNQVFIVHGENQERADLSEKIKSDLGIQNVTLPLLNQTFHLFSTLTSGNQI
jgi:metallo-beta-lactamase family protein